MIIDSKLSVSPRLRTTRYHGTKPPLKYIVNIIKDNSIFLPGIVFLVSAYPAIVVMNMAKTVPAVALNIETNIDVYKSLLLKIIL